jgi:hypothetical protein
MIKFYLIKECKINEINDYFNNYELLNRNIKYDEKFIELLNDLEFIENINEKKNKDNILININKYFSEYKDTLFDTIDIKFKDKYLYQLIYNQNSEKNNENLNILGTILCNDEIIVFGKALLFCYSSELKDYISIDTHMLADLISHRYLIYFIEYNFKTK